MKAILKGNNGDKLIPAITRYEGVLSARFELEGGPELKALAESLGLKSPGVKEGARATIGLTSDGKLSIFLQVEVS